MFSQLATNLIIAYLCLSQGINSSLSNVSRSVLAASIYKVWSTVISRILQGHRIDKVSMIYLYFCKLNKYLIAIVYIISFYNHFAFVCFISYIFIDNRIYIKDKIFSYIFLYLVSYICEIIWFYQYFDCIVILEYRVKNDLICIILLVLYTKQLAFYAYVIHIYICYELSGFKTSKNVLVSCNWSLVRHSYKYVKPTTRFNNCSFQN